MTQLSQFQPSQDIIVLVAEDDAEDRDFLYTVIKESNRNIVLVFVHNGEDLLRFLQKLVITKPIRFPDLVVLDINMPGLSGTDALRILKDDSKTRDVPVAMLTTSNDPSLKTQLLGLGACAFYTKPSRIAEYRYVVHDLIDKCVGSGEQAA